ncbi:MAG: SDR family oxidoreductase [Lachnospiraceae bacterium]
MLADAGEAAYVMTKAALVGLTKCLAVEYADRNIRVNCSQLGYARTPMVEKMALESNPKSPEAAIADIAVGVPMKRLAKPIKVGELFAFLGSSRIKLSDRVPRSLWMAEAHYQRPCSIGTN